MMNSERPSPLPPLAKANEGTASLIAGRTGGVDGMQDPDIPARAGQGVALSRRSGKAARNVG